MEKEKTTNISSSLIYRLHFICESKLVPVLPNKLFILRLSLHIAARNKQNFALKTLLTAIIDHEPPDRQNAILNARNKRGQTALHSAIRASDADAVHYLITAGAQRSILDYDGNSVAHYLADAYNDAIYRDVLFPPADTIAANQNIDLTLRNAAGNTALHLSVKRLKLSLLEELLDASKSAINVPQRNNGWTALHLATDAGDVELVSCLIKNGADVNAMALDGCTPLHLAIRANYERVAILLLDAGARSDTATALWPDQQSTEYVRVAPRDLLATDRMLAILNGERPRENVEVMVENGADEEDDDDEGNLMDQAVGGRERTPVVVATAPIIRRFHASMKDDMGALDIVSRLRLSKLLDVDNKWEQLASALGCEHMIEFIQVCADTSPTHLLLDQYEQLSTAKIPNLIAALKEIGEMGAVTLLEQRRDYDDDTPITVTQPTETND